MTMKASEAIRHMQAVMWTLQRMRSATAEELRTDTNPAMQRVVAHLQPWISGNEGNVLLCTLSDAISNYERNGIVSGSTFYNVAFIVNHRQPEIRLGLEVFARHSDFPTSVSPVLALQELIDEE